MWFGDKGDALGQMLHRLGFTQATLREQIRAWMATKDRLDDSETDAQRKWLHDLGYHQGTLELQWEAYIAALGHGDAYDYCAYDGVSAGLAFDATNFQINVQNATTLQVICLFTPDEAYSPDYTAFTASGGASVTGTTGWFVGTYTLTGTGFAGGLNLTYTKPGSNWMREAVTGTPVNSGTQQMFEGG